MRRRQLAGVGGVDAVRKVAALIGEVSSNAATQDAGFGRVSKAIIHLDETTRQTRRSWRNRRRRP